MIFTLCSAYSTGGGGGGGHTVCLFLGLSVRGGGRLDSGRIRL
jgi:hypothetical protein